MRQRLATLHVLACALAALNSSKTETLPMLQSVYVNKGLNFCEYTPSYLLDPAKVANFGRYRGVYRHAHKIFTFPNTEVEGVTPKRAAHFLAFKTLTQAFCNYSILHKPSVSIFHKPCVRTLTQAFCKYLTQALCKQPYTSLL